THAGVPIKETSAAKRRLADVLCAARRQQLALAMFEDVLATLTSVRGLAGIVVVTVDPATATIAARYGARVSNAGAREGHTGAVAAAARELAAQAMLTLPAGHRAPARWRRHPPTHRLPTPLHWSRRARLHHRAGAGRARLQCNSVLPGRRRAAALRRRQLPAASRRRQAVRHRTDGGAAPTHRARYRHARRLSAVPRYSFSLPHANAGVAGAMAPSSPRRDVADGDGVSDRSD